MIFNLYIRVKFRFMGFTLHTIEQRWNTPVPLPALPFAQEIVDKVKYDNRGVFVQALLIPVTEGIING